MTTIPLLLFGLTLTTGAMPSCVQTADDATVTASTPLQVHVTPFISLGSEFSSRIGAGMTFDLPAEFSIEVEVGYRRDEMAAVNSSANLLYGLPRVHRLAPYVAAGVGVEQYGLPLEIPGWGVTTQKNVGMSTSLGGGVNVELTRRWGYRSDVRWLNPLGKPPEGWRIYHGASFRIGMR